MKYLLIILTILSLSNVSFGSVVEGADGSLTLDVYNACKSSYKQKSCSISADINFTLTCSTYINYNSNYGGYIYCDSGTMRIVSVVPFHEVAGPSEMRMESDGSINYYSYGEKTIGFGNEGRTELSGKMSLGTVLFKTGIPKFLVSSLKSSSAILTNSYKGVLRNLNDFESKIAKSHRSHLVRFKKGLTDGVELLTQVDKKTSKKKHSILHYKVQENSRLIVVFGTVMNELLTDYDDVEYLKMSIKSMRTLVSELREAYGWDKGLAGSVSKASDALLEVMGLELQELGSIKMAMNPEGFDIYISLIKNIRALQAKVKASKSGDMKSQREIFTLVDTWNSQAWQDEVNNLLNAGPDFKNLVLPKLAMLLFAMESIEDLTEAGFIIPAVDFIPKA